MTMFCSRRGVFDGAHLSGNRSPVSGVAFCGSLCAALGSLRGQSYISVPVHPQGFYRLAGASTSVRKGVSDMFSEVANESCSRWGSVFCGRREFLDLEGGHGTSRPETDHPGLPV